MQRGIAEGRAEARKVLLADLVQRSLEGINLNSHEWSDGMPVPERNSWLTK
jgi:hypothetical protein